jgi:hypothetical protein
MFANRISSSTSCSIWLPETSPPSSARDVLRQRFQSCNTSSQPTGAFTSELSAQSVTLLAVGYIYGGIWAPPPTGLSPVRTAASFAAPPHTGIYIAVFFTVSQIVAWVMFRQVPDGRMALGGGLVILGGILMMRP